MSLFTILRVMFFIGIVPIVCGLYAAMRDVKAGKCRLLLKAYVYGWIVQFAVFEIICVPFVVTQRKFSEFTGVYDVGILVVALLSLGFSTWYGVTQRKNALRGKTAVAGGDSNAPCDTIVNGQAGARSRKYITIALWGVVILVIALQMVYLYFFNHMDGDDSYYIAESVITQFFDTMFQRDAYTGMPIGLDERHALSTMPIFVTWLSEMCGMHPAAMAHSILAPVLVMLMYLIYILMGQALLKEHKHYVPVFVLLVNIWYIWGNISIYTAETFMYTRTWQGKAVFSNIIIPLVVYFLYRALSEGKKICWIMLFLLAACGVFTTTAAVYLLPMVYCSAALWKLILEKKSRPCLYLALCCIPSIIYGGVYYYLLSLWRYV